MSRYQELLQRDDEICTAVRSPWVDAMNRASNEEKLWATIWSRRQDLTAYDCSDTRGAVHLGVLIEGVGGQCATGATGAAANQSIYQSRSMSHTG